MHIRQGLHKKGLTALIIILTLLNPHIVLSSPGKRTYTWIDVEKEPEVSQVESPQLDDSQEEDKITQAEPVEKDYKEDETEDRYYTYVPSQKEITVKERLKEYELEKEKLLGNNKNRIIKVDITPWEIENRKAEAREKVRKEQMEKVKNYVLEGGMHEEM